MPTLNQYATNEPIDITLDDGTDDAGDLVYPDLSAATRVIMTAYQGATLLFDDAVTPVEREDGDEICRVQRAWPEGQLDRPVRIRATVTAYWVDGTFTTWPKPDYFVFDVAAQPYNPASFVP